MSTPQRYRKKPVEIEAMLYDGINASEIMEWADASCDQGAGIVAAHDGDPGKAWHLLVGTLEGVMRADLGDWIIRGIAGEFYPCKPDIFEATYEPVEANPLGAADTLRQAAGLMRERAEAATGYMSEADGLHFTSWTPVVALAVADWLDSEADLFDRLERIAVEVAPKGYSLSWGESTQEQALAVARAYLGAAQ